MEMENAIIMELIELSNGEIICSVIRADEYDFRKMILAKKRERKLEIKRRNRALGLRR